MDIRHWGLNRIMQLPDHCFGRRFLVSSNMNVLAAQRVWDISEVALPDVCVIWELVIMVAGTFGTFLWVQIALGDQLPAAVATFDALDPLFMGLGEQGAEPRTIRVEADNVLHLDRLRMPVAAQGRRLVVEMTTDDGITASGMVAIVVSGVPKEVPDWLVSGNLRSP